MGSGTLRAASARSVQSRPISHHLLPIPPSPARQPHIQSLGVELHVQRQQLAHLGLGQGPALAGGFLVHQLPQVGLDQRLAALDDGGVALGDCWHHPLIRAGDATDGLIPFHKLSQWLSYSLIEPLEAAGLAVMISGRSRKAEPEPVTPAPAPEPVVAAPIAPVPAPLEASKVHVGPVRSGQQIYAAGTSLVVLGSVSPGAEVIADGSIHVYAPLRGRALAGASGQTDARIFTTRFEAELVSIAGIYRTFASGVPDGLGGRPVHVQLAPDADGKRNRLTLAALSTD